MNIKSEKIDGVTCRIGVRTKMPSTVTMAVDNIFIMDAVQLFEALERGETPEHGLIGMKLIAIYAGEDERSIDEAKDKIAGLISQRNGWSAPPEITEAEPTAESSGKPLELVVEDEDKSKDEKHEVVVEDLKGDES